MTTETEQARWQYLQHYTAAQALASQQEAG